MIFIDASLLIAAENADDTNHAKAVGLLSEIKEGRYGQATLTNSVFGEVMNVMAFKYRDKRAAIAFGRRILASYEITHSSDEDTDDAFSLFSNSKRELSFADCEQVAIARKRSYRIATFDKNLADEVGSLAVDRGTPGASN